VGSLRTRLSLFSKWGFFIRRQLFADARAVYSHLRASFDAHPPEFDGKLAMWLESTAATRGWAAAAELCEQPTFPDALGVWEQKAWALRYAGRDAACEQAAKAVLGLISTPSNRVRAAVQALALSSCHFSVDDQAKVNALIDSFESAIAHHSDQEQAGDYRALAHLELKLGRLHESLRDLDQSEARQLIPQSGTMFLRAMCLQRLNELTAARAARQAADALLEGETARSSGNQDEGFWGPTNQH
jgi:hypothetical protein